MSTEHSVEDSIGKTATTVGSIWPVHPFVMVNPFSRSEDMSFSKTVTQAADLVGDRGYPSPETFETALEGGQIDPTVPDAELADRGCDGDPEVLLERTGAGAEFAGVGDDVGTDAARVGRMLTRWLSAFLDEGQAH